MKQKWIYALSLAAVLLICTQAEETAKAVEEALLLCARRVIPNLFPFFVLSSFMVQTGFTAAAGRLLAPLSRRLFRVSGSGAAVFAVGLLCGYPTGAKTVAELYESGQIDREEAHRLLPFCNNSGPLFVIGAVGGMLGSTALGIRLYMIHALSAFCVGILLSFRGKAHADSDNSSLYAVQVGAAFSGAVSRSVTAMLNICGYILFFSVIRAFFLPFMGEGGASLLLSGFAEVTLGAETVVGAKLPFGETIVLLSAVISFGGVCVLLQVWGEVSRVGLSIKSYFWGKLLQTGIAALLAWGYVCLQNGAPLLLAAEAWAMRPGTIAVFGVGLPAVFGAIKLTNRYLSGIIGRECKNRRNAP